MEESASNVSTHRAGAAFGPMKAVVATGSAAVLAAGLGMTAPLQALAAEADAPVAASERAADGYYVISDNYPGLAEQLAAAAGKGYAKVRVGSDFTGSASGAGVTVPASIVELAGYSSGFFNPGPHTYDIGYSYAMPVLFPDGSTATVDHLRFYKRNAADAAGATVAVAAGASVRFSNCTFSNAPVVNGAAVFEDCVFETGTIVNNGTATYTGSTKEPENTGTQSPAHQPLALSLPQGKAFPAAVQGDAVQASLPFEVKGTSAASAQVAATVVDGAGAQVQGLDATVDAAAGTVALAGTAPAAGSYRVLLNATAEQAAGTPESAEETLTFQVQERIQVKLEGELQAFVVDGTSVRSADSYGAMATSTGGGSTSATQGVTLKPVVKEGDGSWMPWNEFAAAHDDAAISFSISPEGSGMAVNMAYDTAFVSGTPAKPGTYGVTATVTSGARTQTSEPVQMRIYANDKNLQQHIDDLPAGTASWDMEPYTIAETGNAVIPATLADIYGSHESGVYGTIGKGENGNFATETLTIPAGADVTLHNMKVYSSVKIVVEKGGKLTLDDSVAYGAVEVNGGTLSAKNSSSFVNRITLNDGSTLEDADIVSHAYFLTDGNRTVEAPLSPVLTNGDVTFKGTNTIKAEDSVAGADGQTGLVVSNGTATIPQGSSLTVTGGKVELGPDDGGDAVLLQNGVITGGGILTAVGGNALSGDAGAGIAGTGKVSVAELHATGGSVPAQGEPVISGGEAGQAGNGVDADVAVSKDTAADVHGGAGAHPGSADFATFDPAADNGGGDSGSGGQGGSGSDGGDALSGGGSGQQGGSDGQGAGDSGAGAGSAGQAGSTSGPGSAAPAAKASAGQRAQAASAKASLPATADGSAAAAAAAFASAVGSGAAAAGCALRRRAKGAR